MGSLIEGKQIHGYIIQNEFRLIILSQIRLFTCNMQNVGHIRGLSRGLTENNKDEDHVQKGCHFMEHNNYGLWYSWIWERIS